MKKLLLSIFVMLALSTTAVALAKLSEENVASVTASLEELGYSIQEVMIDGDTYSVIAKKQGQNFVVIVNDAFEVIDETAVAE